MTFYDIVWIRYPLILDGGTLQTYKLIMPSNILTRFNSSK